MLGSGSGEFDDLSAELEPIIAKVTADRQGALDNVCRNVLGRTAYQRRVRAGDVAQRVRTVGKQERVAVVDGREGIDLSVRRQNERSSNSAY